MRRLQFLYTAPLLVLLFALSLVSCRDAIFDYSHPDPSDSPQPEVSVGEYFEATVSFSSTELKVPTLRALDKAGENEIQKDKVTAYVFKSTATSTTFLYEAKVTNVEPDVTKNKAEGKITLLIKDSGDQFVKVFFVVNATRSKAPAFGTTLEDFQKLFVFDQKDLWGAGELPMYAESQAVKISHSSGAVPSLQQTPIPFLRAVARVDVMLGDKSGEKFDEKTTGLKTKAGQDLKITSIKAFNVADKGYAMPFQTNVENATTAPKVNATSLPEGLTKKSTPTSYLADNTGVDALMRTIYIPELKNTPHKATTQANGQNQTNYLERPYLILGIKGAVAGDADKVTYFRVDYLKRAGEEASATYEYLDILRNYRYMVNITNIGGPGFDSEEDAKKGPAANIMYNVVVWDESTLSNVVYDGQYMLGVSQDKIQFSKEAGELVSIKVQTSWKDGFEVKNLPEWIDKEEIKPAKEGANSKTDEKVVTFRVNSSTNVERNWLNTKDHEGAYIQAGRMRWNLSFTQKNTINIEIAIFSDPECTKELQYIELDERGNKTLDNEYTVGKMKFYVRVTPAARISAVSDETKAPFIFTGAAATSPSRPPIERATEVSPGVYEFEVTADSLSNPKDPFETRQNKYHFITEQYGEKAEATLSINQTEYNIVFYEDKDLTNPMLNEGDADTYFMDGTDKQFYVRSNIPYIIWMDNQMIDESARNSENANADGSSKFPIVTGYYDKDGKFVQLDYKSNSTLINWRSVKTEEAPTPNGSPLKFKAAETDNALKIIYGHVMWVACTTMKSMEWKFPLYDKEQDNQDKVTKIQTNFVAGYVLPEANCYPLTLGYSGVLIPLSRINHAADFYERNMDAPADFGKKDYVIPTDQNACIGAESWETYKKRNSLNRLDEDDDIDVEVLWTDVKSVTEKASAADRNPIKADGTAPLRLLTDLQVAGERYIFLVPGKDGSENYGNLVLAVRSTQKKKVNNNRYIILDPDEKNKKTILWSFHLMLYRPVAIAPNGAGIPKNNGLVSTISNGSVTFYDKTQANDSEYNNYWYQDIYSWPYDLGAFKIPEGWDNNLPAVTKDDSSHRDLDYRAIGMSYQFGRKDPFPRWHGAKNPPSRFVGDKGKEVFFKLHKNTTISMRESIENPMVVVGSGRGEQWLTEGGKGTASNIGFLGSASFPYYGLWGGGAAVGNEDNANKTRLSVNRSTDKTVFDPTPYGFSVPAPGYSSTRVFNGSKYNVERFRPNFARYFGNPEYRLISDKNASEVTIFGVTNKSALSITGEQGWAVSTTYVAQAHYPIFTLKPGTAAFQQRYADFCNRSAPIALRPFNNLKESDWEKYIRR